MRLSIAALLALAGCTSTHTVTVAVPPARMTCSASEGACANVVIQDDMGSSFAMDHSFAMVDGVLTQPGLVGLAPGAHELLVDFGFHFVSNCGYCYARAYAFHVRSLHAFTVAKGTTLEIRAIAYEKGGVTTPLEERPAVRFVETLTR